MTVSYYINNIKKCEFEINDRRGDLEIDDELMNHLSSYFKRISFTNNTKLDIY